MLLLSPCFKGECMYNYRSINSIGVSPQSIMQLIKSVTSSLIMYTYKTPAITHGSGVLSNMGLRTELSTDFMEHACPCMPMQ